MAFKNLSTECTVGQSAAWVWLSLCYCEESYFAVHAGEDMVHTVTFLGTACTKGILLIHVIEPESLLLKLHWKQLPAVISGS